MMAAISASQNGNDIIITEDGIAKVTDFGIAKAVSNSTITAFGSTIGSVHYFSPEHARGGYTDAKSDLYSLGVVLYEMVTGKVPFNADTPVSVALKHMQENPKQPIELNPAIPKSVNDIIMKAMQKDINLRYQSATDMLKDLSRAIKSPNSDFVVMEKQENDFPTQRLSTIYDKSSDNNKEKKEQKGLKKFIKEHKTLSIFLGAILLFILTILITNIILNVAIKKDVQVPELVGMERSEAKSKAEELKLKYVEGEEAFNKDTPAGYIISQDPIYMPNYSIKEGSTITVIVSKGRNVVTVPKLIGLTKDEAVETLEELGLSVNITEEYDKKVEEGYVIEQDVKQNEEIDAGETITLKVSKGIEKVTVPNLVGKTEDEAKKLITDKGLKLKKVEVEKDETKEDGKVIKQDLEANTEVEKDSYITITINSLPTNKKGRIIVNVKSLLERKGKPTVNEDNTPKIVKVDVVVNGKTIKTQDVDATVTSLEAQFSEKGWIDIAVLIDDVRYTADNYGKDLETEKSSEIVITIN